MEKFYFTFGSNHLDADGNSLGDCYVAIEDEDFRGARQKIFDARGTKWSMQYLEKEYDNCIAPYALKELTVDEVAL